MTSWREFADVAPQIAATFVRRHTATVDTHVTNGDAKLWGVVEDVQGKALHRRGAEEANPNASSASTDALGP